MVMAVEEKRRFPKLSPVGLGAETRIGMGKRAGTRETFVLAIFSEPHAADAAFRQLAAPGKGGNPILITEAEIPRSMAAGSPFRALWARLSCFDAVSAAVHSTGRLAQQLTRSLADGGSAIVARTHEPARQLAISRALLDAGCDVLLTCDIKPGDGPA